jgi:hypothetical protein
MKLKEWVEKERIPDNKNLWEKIQNRKVQGMSRIKLDGGSVTFYYKENKFEAFSYSSKEDSKIDVELANREKILNDLNYLKNSLNTLSRDEGKKLSKKIQTSAKKLPNKKLKL